MPRLTRRLPLAAALIALLFAGATHAEPTQVETVLTDAGPIEVVELASGLEHPWGMAFLPDGRLLVTERAGRLRILDKNNELSDPIEGVPTVWAQGQGGLLDVALSPDFENNRYVYLTYAKPGPEGQAAAAMGRGELQDEELVGFEELFVQQPWIKGPNHFGCRIAFGPDGKMFLTLGERYQFDPAQDLSNHLGKVLRLNADGSVPDDNPFVDDDGARPEVWSYGHRNIQSAAVHPETGELWIAEMGPLGGDELNRPEAGKNYGWPVVSWGMNYDGSPIPDPTTRPEFADAVMHWTPVISPAGMTFYDGDAFSDWKGCVMIGGLSAHDLVVVKLDGDTVDQEWRVPLPDRIRDVEVAPDGSIYVLVDKRDGFVWQMKPLR